MERKKIYYGWFVVFGCLMITCTMVPPIMALSNKFLIQVTGELQISRSALPWPIPFSRALESSCLLLCRPGLQEAT